jgi:simple sugar transport system ATP-binding protein
LPTRLELRSICKRYHGTVANDGVCLEVAPGEIHAILGENGAGKSTLMKIIYGAIAADAGEILWEGVPVHIGNPAAARHLGIGMVYQHFSLFESVTVVENIALTVEAPFDLAALSARLRDLAHRFGLEVAPERLLHHLSVGERQRVEILRCLMQNPKLLILDEPTSVLTPQEVQNLFRVLRGLAAGGCSILYITHKLDEIRDLCDRATILRAGRVAGSANPRDAWPASLARLMVGADPAPVVRPVARPEATPRLAVRGLSREPDDPFGTTLQGLSLAVSGGEILGIAGISGNGQKELLALLSGEARCAPDSIQIDGAAVGHYSASRRRALGLAYVPEDRLGTGAAAQLSLTDNALLTGHRAGLVRHGFIVRDRTESFAQSILDNFDVRCTGTRVLARQLSGGNLQKFIVGREVSLAPRVLVVAQPTWGVDVAASTFLRQTLIDLSRRGTAILVICEDLDELFELCDRIGVIHRGRLSEPKPVVSMNREQIGLMMTGSVPA